MLSLQYIRRKVNVMNIQTLLESLLIEANGLLINPKQSSDILKLFDKDESKAVRWIAVIEDGKRNFFYVASSLDWTHQQMLHKIHPGPKDEFETGQAIYHHKKQKYVVPKSLNKLLNNAKWDWIQFYVGKMTK